MSGFDGLQRDMAAVARDLDNLDDTQRDVSALLAPSISDEAPVLTGFLAGSVGVDAAGVGVGAPYAGFVHAHNPFVERGVDAADWLQPVQDRVDTALGHIQPLYL